MSVSIRIIAFLFLFKTVISNNHSTVVPSNISNISPHSTQIVTLYRITNSTSSLKQSLLDNSRTNFSPKQNNGTTNNINKWETEEEKYLLGSTKVKRRRNRKTTSAVLNNSINSTANNESPPISHKKYSTKVFLPKPAVFLTESENYEKNETIGTSTNFLKKQPQLFETTHFSRTQFQNFETTTDYLKKQQSQILNTPSQKAHYSNSTSVLHQTPQQTPSNKPGNRNINLPVPPEDINEGLLAEHTQHRLSSSNLNQQLQNEYANKGFLNNQWLPPQSINQGLQSSKLEPNLEYHNQYSPNKIVNQVSTSIQPTNSESQLRNNIVRTQGRVFKYKIQRKFPDTVSNIEQSNRIKEVSEISNESLQTESSQNTYNQEFQVKLINPQLVKTNQQPTPTNQQPVQKNQQNQKKDENSNEKGPIRYLLPPYLDRHLFQHNNTSSRGHTKFKHTLEVEKLEDLADDSYQPEQLQQSQFQQPLQMQLKQSIQQPNIQQSYQQPLQRQQEPQFTKLPPNQSNQQTLQNQLPNQSIQQPVQNQLIQQQQFQTQKIQQQTTQLQLKETSTKNFIDYDTDDNEIEPYKNLDFTYVNNRRNISQYILPSVNTTPKPVLNKYDSINKIPNSIRFNVSNTIRTSNEYSVNNNINKNDNYNQNNFNYNHYNNNYYNASTTNGNNYNNNYYNTSAKNGNNYKNQNKGNYENSTGSKFIIDYRNDGLYNNTVNLENINTHNNFNHASLYNNKINSYDKSKSTQTYATQATIDYETETPNQIEEELTRNVENYFLNIPKNNAATANTHSTFVTYSRTTTAPTTRTTTRGTTVKYNSPQISTATAKKESKTISLDLAESSYFADLPSKDDILLQQTDDDIPGVAGIDYPIYSRPVQTDYRFSCRGLEGYFADKSTKCQVFYICNGDGAGEPVLCPNGTLFSQDLLVCDWWYNVDC